MAKNGKSNRVLVVSSETALVDMVRKAVGDSLEVIYASNQEEGLEITRKEMPDIIALGYIEPQRATLALQRQLQEGWITKGIPILLIYLDPQDSSWRVLSTGKELQVEADRYIYPFDKEERTVISQLAKPIDELKDILQSLIKEQANSVKEAILNPEKFCITWEQIPGRGAFETQQEKLIENVIKAAKRGGIHAVSVTDNPGGNPALSTEMLCTEIKKLGIEPLVHLAFRDKNRNECESLLYGLAALEVRNLLLLTGDYPSDGGFKGRAKPVFDLDSVQGLEMVESMNKGLEHRVMWRERTVSPLNFFGGAPASPSKKQEAELRAQLQPLVLWRERTLSPTDFFAGTAVSPFKQQEAELMGQYYKLKKKIEAGAKYIITQVGYDARKYHELLQWLKVNGYNIPVLANIYILPFGSARTFNSNQVPGCVVPDKLLAEIGKEREAEDKGRATRLDRASKMYAIAKGMGCAGAHIGGHGSTYEMVEEIIDKGEKLLPNWQDLVNEFDFPQENGFYLFKKDVKTGLNLNEPTAQNAKAIHPPVYLLSRVAHVTLFNPDSVVFKLLKPAARFLDSKPSLKSIFGTLEHMGKAALFDCMNCGDCSLFDVAFLCPMSQCPKNQRNGPCGGSYEGWCEINTDKKCIWVQAYKRLKGHKKESSIGDYIVPPCNWELTSSSSWLNFYLGRDHTAKRLGLEPPEIKQP